jgi:hypothetical protein
VVDGLADLDHLECSMQEAEYNEIVIPVTTVALLETIQTLHYFVVFKKIPI